MKSSKDLNILVRLPAKLGDSILAMPFLYALPQQFPDASIYVIVQKEFTDITRFMPMISGYHAFSKKDYSGIKGVRKFAKEIKQQRQYDLYFCLPYSFSSGLIGFFAGIPKRIGLSIEYRRMIFTHAYKIPPGINFGDEFLYLLERFTGNKISRQPVYYTFKEAPAFPLPSPAYIILNVNAGEQSRSIPTAKAASLIQSMHQHFGMEILLAGSPKEKERLDSIIALAGNPSYAKNIAGDYSLDQLGWVLHKAKCVLSGDSGLAHFANHMGAPTVVIFGAAEDSHTSPYNQPTLTILKKTELPCVPCKKAVCKFGDPLCITELPDQYIISEMESLMKRVSG